MNIKTDKDITGQVAKDIRIMAGISQTAFWRDVGVKQASASKYEAGRNVPTAVRKLIFLQYVAGVEINTNNFADDPRNQEK